MLFLHPVELTCQPLSESMRRRGDKLNLLVLVKDKEKPWSIFRNNNKPR